AEREVRVRLPVDLRLAAARRDLVVDPAGHRQTRERVRNRAEAAVALALRTRDARADHRVGVSPGDAGALDRHAAGDVAPGLVALFARVQHLRAELLGLRPGGRVREVAGANRLELRRAGAARGEGLVAGRGARPALQARRPRRAVADQGGRGAARVEAALHL